MSLEISERAKRLWEQLHDRIKNEEAWDLIQQSLDEEYQEGAADMDGDWRNDR